MLRRSCPTYAAFILLAASGVEIIRAGSADQPSEGDEYISISICGQYERVEKAGGYTHWIRGKTFLPSKSTQRQSSIRFNGLDWTKTSSSPDHSLRWMGFLVKRPAIPGNRKVRDTSSASPRR